MKALKLLPVCSGYVPFSCYRGAMAICLCNNVYVTFFLYNSLIISVRLIVLIVKAIIHYLSISSKVFFLVDFLGYRLVL